MFIVYSTVFQPCIHYTIIDFKKIWFWYKSLTMLTASGIVGGQKLLY